MRHERTTPIRHGFNVAQKPSPSSRTFRLDATRFFPVFLWNCIIHEIPIQFERKSRSRHVTSLRPPVSPYANAVYSLPPQQYDFDFHAIAISPILTHSAPEFVLARDNCSPAEPRGRRNPIRHLPCRVRRRLFDFATYPTSEKPKPYIMQPLLRDGAQATPCARRVGLYHQRIHLPEHAT